MKRDHHRWYSDRLHRDMDLLIFGESGARVLIFPTRDGRFWEYEDMGVVARLAPRVAAGHLQLWCVDSLDRETLYGTWGSPADRLHRHLAFESYVLEEVLPLMERINPHPATIAHGCSLGAFHAANIAFRHPCRFQKLAAFSGRYDLTRAMEDFADLFAGHYDDAVYYNTPNHFLPGLEDPDALAALRRMDIVLTIGAEDPFLEDNRHLSRVLAAKGIGHRFEVWDGRAHSAGAWRRMAELYV
ncbi:esterase [Siculibacillus lacustris]|uniref:Esterase n=1 Tax=Siculibacillus lacustris TaxID=1549641 RepID=A0A4Q9VJU5_9HYPH|nr:alpha/beta hydrolase-fold protein [Siculibacillus lacustris]TBW34723.1 esterase [Siculibacillus lacustris]